MGLFDLPAPLFASMDALLQGGVPAAGRLVLWGVAAGIASMALYRLISPQGRIAALKRQAADARAALNAYDGAFAGAGPLMRRQFALSLRLIAVALGPAVLASLPVLSLIVWLSAAYGHSFPPAGTAPPVRTDPAMPAHWIADADTQGQGLAPRIVVGDGPATDATTIVMKAPVPVLHPRRWWNMLIANPAGYVPETFPVREIAIALPRQQILALGPAWLRGWEATFFAALLIAALTVKIVFRIR
ncbi:MAG: hypothetical protein ACTS3R_19700 [Inquilinaceae bacterium]